MITTQDSYMTEKRSLEAMYTRRELSLVWTTTPIQPLQSQYGPNNQLQIILQKSRHMIPVGQIQIAFRPMVVYDSNFAPFASLAQKYMLCVTAVQPADFLAFSSATVEGNQLCSQTNLAPTRPRNIIQNYMNMLKTAKSKNILKGEECYGSGLIESAGNGSRNTGFPELSVTHPYSATNATGANNASRFEADPFPRAIVERSLIYNADFCIPAPNASPSTNDSYPANSYFAPQVTTNADGLLQTAITPGVYPLLGLSITPSVAVYKAQQTRFADFRQRYLTQMVTSYYKPDILAEAWGVTNEVSQTAISTGSAVVNATPALASAVAGTINPNTFAGQQKVMYGNPVNYDTALGGQDSGPYRGSGVPTGTNATYRPPEQYSSCVVSIAETAMEFNPEVGGIDMMCMEQTQLQMQWLFNTPENVLSAYIQPSYFGTSGAAGNSTGAGAANNVTFLKCCVLSGITYKVVDVCLRVPYYTYHDETAYSIVKEICYQPASYPSIRVQIDDIGVESGGQVFSRISVGGSSIILGVWVFFVRNATTNGSLAAATAADCMVNYDGVNPPGAGDLRSVQSMDSSYIQMQDVYCQINNKRYNVNAIPIASPALSTYLVTQSNLESAFGKHLNVSFREFTKNRFGFFINVNPFADRSQIITDNQLIVGASLDFSNRIQNSTMYGETSRTSAGKWSMLTCAITMQSMVSCAYVKVA